MRKALRPVSVIAALALAAGLSSCSTQAPTTASGTNAVISPAPQIPYTGPEAGLPTSYPDVPTDVKKGFTFGYMNINGADPGLNVSQDAAQKRVEDLGGTFISKDDQADVTTQVNHCNELI